MSDILNNETVDTPPRDAATIVLMRDCENSKPEILLLRRGNSHTVMNNAYVFPGGKLDDEDETAEKIDALKLAGDANVLLNEPDLPKSRAAALFVAAARETQEETGVTVATDQIVPISRWITPNTPTMMRKRFDARFFVARMPDGQTAVHDGEEATDSGWFTAADALRAYYAGDITLAPPQIMTLAGLLPYQTVDEILKMAVEATPGTVQPHVFKHADDQRVLAYPGDRMGRVAERAIPGPSRLVWRDERFEPEEGQQVFFADAN